MNARLPYCDDTFDGDDQIAAAQGVEGELTAVEREEAVSAARARVAEADEAHRMAKFWRVRATGSNLAIRQRHLEDTARAALEAAVALRMALGQP